MRGAAIARVLRWAGRPATAPAVGAGMAEQDLLDDDLRALDRLAEERGAAALPALQAAVDRMRNEGDRDRLDVGAAAAGARVRAVREVRRGRGRRQRGAGPLPRQRLGARAGVRAQRAGRGRPSAAACPRARSRWPARPWCWRARPRIRSCRCASPTRWASCSTTSAACPRPCRSSRKACARRAASRARPVVLRLRSNLSLALEPLGAEGARRARARGQLAPARRARDRADGARRSRPGASRSKWVDDQRRARPPGHRAHRAGRPGGGARGARRGRVADGRVGAALDGVLQLRPRARAPAGQRAAARAAGDRARPRGGRQPRRPRAHGRAVPPEVARRTSRAASGRRRWRRTSASTRCARAWCSSAPSSRPPRWPSRSTPSARCAR